MDAAGAKPHHHTVFTIREFFKIADTTFVIALIATIYTGFIGVFASERYFLSLYTPF